MARGHGSRVWDYGYSIFLEALIHTGQEDLETIANMALAVRFGRLAQNEDWKKLTEDSSSKAKTGRIREDGDKLIRRMGINRGKQKND